MRILSCDPGESTGWALWEDGKLISQGVITNGVEGAILWAMTDMPEHDTLILESFIVEPDFVGRSFASEVIGILLLRSRQMGATVHAFQSRGQKATVVRGSETERFRWLRNHGFTGTSHELDAISHGLLRMRLEGNAEVVNRYWGTKKAPHQQG